MSPFEKEVPDVAQIDWGRMKHWQIWDPIPWWILDKEKLEKIMVVQLEAKVSQLKGEIEQLQKIAAIIGQR
jgi:hypothetical protein